MILKRLLLMFVLSQIAGCSAPPSASPPATAQTVEAAITPALRPLGDALHACAQAHPEIALFLDETPANALDLAGDRLAFWLGEPPVEAKFAAPLAYEQIVVIVHADNPINSLSAQTLSDLFSGAISNWQALSASSLPVQVWFYLPGDEARNAFQAAVLQNKRVSPQARLAPDPQAMLEAVTKEPGAIGYLPAAWLAVEADRWTIKPVQLGSELETSLHLPVLALSANPPGRAAQTFLACLQGEQGQRSLEAKYAPWQE